MIYPLSYLLTFLVLLNSIFLQFSHFPLVVIRGCMVRVIHIFFKCTQFGSPYTKLLSILNSEDLTDPLLVDSSFAVTPLEEFLIMFSSVPFYYGLTRNFFYLLISPCIISDGVLWISSKHFGQYL